MLNGSFWEIFKRQLVAGSSHSSNVDDWTSKQKPNSAIANFRFWQIADMLLLQPFSARIIQWDALFITTYLVLPD